MLNNKCETMNNCLKEEICVENKNSVQTMYDPYVNKLENALITTNENKSTMDMSNLRITNSHMNGSNDITKSDYGSSYCPSVLNTHRNNVVSRNVNRIVYGQQHGNKSNTENSGSDCNSSRRENGITNHSGVSYSTENGLSQNMSEDSLQPRESSHMETDSSDENAKNENSHKELWKMPNGNNRQNMKYFHIQKEQFGETPMNSNNNTNVVWGEDQSMNCYKDANHNESGNNSTVKSSVNNKMASNHNMNIPENHKNVNHMIPANGSLGNNGITNNDLEITSNPSNTNSNNSNSHSIGGTHENHMNMSQAMKSKFRTIESGKMNSFNRQCNDSIVWECKGKEECSNETNGNERVLNKMNKINTNNAKSGTNRQSTMHLKEQNGAMDEINALYALMRTKQFDNLEVSSHPDTKQFDFVTCNSQCNESDNNSTEHYSVDQRDDMTKRNASSTSYFENTNKLNGENTHEKRKVLSGNTQITSKDLLNVNNGILEEFIENNNNNNSTNSMNQRNSNTNTRININHHNASNHFNNINNSTSNTNNDSTCDIMNPHSFSGMSMNNTTMYNPNNIDITTMNHFGIHNANTNNAKQYMNTTSSINHLQNQGIIFQMNQSSNQHPISNIPSSINSINYSNKNHIVNHQGKEIYDIQEPTTNNLSPLRRSYCSTNPYTNINNMQIDDPNGIITINGMNYVSSSNTLNNVTSMNQLNQLNQMNHIVDPLGNMHTLNNNINNSTNLNGMNNQQLFKMQVQNNSDRSKSNTQLNAMDYMNSIENPNSFRDVGKTNISSQVSPHIYSTNYSQELSVYPQQMNQGSGVRHNEIYPYVRNYIGKQRNSSSTLPTGNFNRNMSNSILNGMNRNFLNSPIETSSNSLYEQSIAMNEMNHMMMHRNESIGFNGMKQEQSSTLKNNECEPRNRQIETLHKHKKVKKTKATKGSNENKKKKEKIQTDMKDEELKKAYEEYDEHYGSALPKIKGVRFDRLGKRWVASWSQNGSQKRQYFPIKKYGSIQSKYLAVYARIKALRYINKIKKTSEAKNTTATTKNMDYLYEDLFHNLQFIFVHQFKNANFDRDCYDVSSHGSKTKWTEPNQHTQRDKKTKHYNDTCFEEIILTPQDENTSVKKEMIEQHPEAHSKELLSIEKREESNISEHTIKGIYNHKEEKEIQYYNSTSNQFDPVTSKMYMNQFNKSNENGKEQFANDIHSNKPINNESNKNSNVQIKEETIHEHFERIRIAENKYRHNTKEEEEEDDSDSDEEDYDDEDDDHDEDDE